MASQKKKSNPSSTEKFECEWCKASFKSEKTFTVHLCTRRDRWRRRNDRDAKLGYELFNIFYESAMYGHGKKDLEYFIKSQYYSGFIRFANTCLVRNYLYPEKFIEWLLVRNEKIEAWNKESLYNRYLLEYIHTEPALDALERTISNLASWSVETGDKWNEYFVKVTPYRLMNDVLSGKISPWVIYLSATGGQVFEVLDESQLGPLSTLINPDVWRGRFRKEPDSVSAVESICKEAKL